MVREKEIHKIHADYISGDKFLRSLKGEEEIGRGFFYEIVFYSEEIDLDSDKILGETFCVEVVRGESSRFFNGIVCDFLNIGRFGGYQVYRVELRSEFWLLTQQHDCRIFQNKSVLDIVSEVLKNDSNLVTVEKKVTASYEAREFCTQYRESSYDFVCRLLEKEGIHFYFRHEKNKHTMVLIDADSTISPISGDSKVPFRPPSPAIIDYEHVSRLRRNFRLRSGKVELDDFDFEKSQANLQVRSQDNVKHKHGKFERYDYPGKYLETTPGNQYARVLLEEIRVQHKLTSAFGNSLGFSAGFSFELEDHPTGKNNTEFLITHAQINIESGEIEQLGQAENEFEIEMTLIEKTEKFRSAKITPKPFVHGPQTAIVVGKAGEEIWTDKYGRVKIQFHWDRLGKKDENSSCWVRVSQGWAGKNWGMIHIPRIGQEVIVDFLEGDPDRPVITGRLYNNANPVPYDLPANQTQSGILSRSTSGGTAETANELRFEDKKNEEEIYFHAEKDFNRVVENNDTLKVGLVKKDAGDQTVEIWNNRTHTIKNGNDSLTVETGNRSSEVSQGNDDLKVTAGNRNVKIGQKLTVEAGTQITLKCGVSQIVLKPAEISIQSPQVKISGSAKVEVSAPMVEVNGSGMLNLSGGMVKIN